LLKRIYASVIRKMAVP